MLQRICSESSVKHPSAASQRALDGGADPAQAFINVLPNVFVGRRERRAGRIAAETY